MASGAEASSSSLSQSQQNPPASSAADQQAQASTSAATTSGGQQQQQQTRQGGNGGAATGAATGGRGSKRKAQDSSAGSSGGQSGGAQAGKKSKGVLFSPPLGPNAFPKEFPYNRDGYRYVLAEADPHAPLRKEMDESADMDGRPIPGFLCRVLTPQTVLLSMHDRAQQVNVHDDRLTLTGYKFYCTVRANHGVRRGTWYFETRVLDMKEGAATRIGWGRRYANLQAPLGFDKFGYSVRSRKGTKFHESCGKSYSAGYKEGDYVGCLIELPEEADADYLPKSYKDKPLIKFKNHFYFEEKDGTKEAVKALRPLQGSKITFFKNGECLGEAFKDVYAVRANALFTP